MYNLKKFINNQLSKEFNLEHYKIEINGNDIKYVDYVLYFNDIRTNLGYTVALDKNNSIHLYDNMNNILEQEALTKIEKLGEY